MRALAGALPSLLLRLLLTSSPEPLGANPGLVARITDKGLEYGKKLWLLAGLGTRWAPGCSGNGGGHQRGALPRGGEPRSGLVTHLLCHSGALFV